MSHFNFSALSKEEEGVYNKFHQWYDRKLVPVCVFFQKYRFKPDFLTYIGLGCQGLFVYFFTFNPWIALIFLALNGFFDMLDGSFARFLHYETARGSILDKAADHLAFLMAFFTFMYFGLIGAFWGALYLVSYVILIFFAFIFNARNISLPPIIRSKYIIYVFLLIWLFSGNNFFDPVVVFLSLYMIVADLFLFYKFRCSL